VSSELLQLRSWGKTAIADAVLLLGPLYHLCSLEERQNAMREAARMLKPTAYCLPQALIDWFETYFRANQRKLSFVKTSSLQDGNVDPEHAPPLGYGHLTTQTEFRQLFETEFDQVAMIGLNLSPPFTTVHTLAPEQVEAWMDLVETTGQTQRD